MRNGALIVGLDYKNKNVKLLMGIVQHYNPQKYWKMREFVVADNRGGVLNKLKKIWYLYRIKEMDAFNNASMGTNIGFGAKFGSIPKFPHGLNGIIVSPYASIGKNAYIFHQVTIGDDGIDKHNAPVIGDNVTLYAGCKIVGKCHIGNNAKIGANAVVSFDVPENAIVVCEKPIVKIKQ